MRQERNPQNGRPEPLDAAVRQSRARRVHVMSMFIVLVTWAVVHLVVPGWHSLAVVICAVCWAGQGYQHCFGGWPAVTTLRASGRALVLALAWPLVRSTRERATDELKRLNPDHPIVVMERISGRTLTRLAWGHRRLFPLSRATIIFVGRAECVRRVQRYQRFTERALAAQSRLAGPAAQWTGRQFGA